MKNLLFLLASIPLVAQNVVSVRILLGVGDTTSVRWDGTVETSGASIKSIDPWRFEGADGIVDHMWHVSTHTVRLFSGTVPTALPGSGIVANGIIVTASLPGDDAEFKVTTAQGDFSFRQPDALWNHFA